MGASERPQDRSATGEAPERPMRPLRQRTAVAALGACLPVCTAILLCLRRASRGPLNPPA
eukprot:851822-Prymnesium_polylepis.1